VGRCRRVIKGLGIGEDEDDTGERGFDDDNKDEEFKEYEGEEEESEHPECL
jgi:hypothetical protein